MVLPGAEGQPDTRGTVDAILAGRRRRRRPIKFGSGFESRRNKDRWSNRLRKADTQRRIRLQLERQTKEDTTRSLPSLKETTERISAQRRLRTVEQRQERERPSVFRRPERQLFDSTRIFGDDKSRAVASQTLNKLPPSVRTIMSMALDPEDKIPIASLSEETRQRLASARGGDPTALVELTNEPKFIDEISDVGRKLIKGRAQLERVEKQFLRQEKRVRPVSVTERLRREEVINEPSPVREFVRQARTAAGIFRDDIVPGGAPVPEAEVVVEQTTFIEKIKSEFYPGRENEVEVDFNDAADQLIFQLPGAPPRGFALPSVLAEQVHGKDIAENYALQGPRALPEDSPLHKPGIGKDTFRFLSAAAELVGGTGELLVRSTVEEVGESLPAQLLGIDVSESKKEQTDKLAARVTAQYGDIINEVVGKPVGAFLDTEITAAQANALRLSFPGSQIFFGGGAVGEKPATEPITIGEAAVRTIERIDEPRLQVKRQVIEPILPEFEFDVSLAEALPFVVPPLAMATLAIKGLELATGLDIPELKDLLEKIPGLDTKITITDDIVAEVMSFGIDPLNLLPVIGFGPEIIKLTRFAATGGRRALLKLARNPKFLRAMDDGLKLVKAESGILSTGGRRAQLEARQQILSDIDEGVETTNATLLPVRKELDNFIDNTVNVKVPTVADLPEDAAGRATLYRGVTSSDAEKLGRTIEPTEFWTHDKSLAEIYAARRALPGDVPIVITVKAPKAAIRSRGTIYFSTTETVEISARGEARSLAELRAAETTIPAEEARQNLLRRLIDETDEALAKLDEGEIGGARLRAFNEGDTVRLREGEFRGESGVIRSSRKKALSVELKSGKVVRVRSHQVDALDILPEAVEELGVPVAARTRAERLVEITEELKNASPKVRRALTKEAEEIEATTALADTLAKVVEPGGKLAERPAQLNRLKTLRERLGKVKGEGRKAPIRREIEALEEAIEKVSPVAEQVPVAVQVKEAFLASQSEAVEQLFRRRAELKLQLTSRRGLMSQDELLRAEAQLKEVQEELVRIRSEADEVVEALTVAERKPLEGELSPETLTMDDFEQFAFSRMSPAGKVVRLVGKLPLFHKTINLYDLSVINADNFIFRKWLAYNRLLESLAASTEATFRALTAKSVPFKRSAEGLEELTGRTLFDLVEDWNNVKHLFGAEQDEFVQLLNKARVEALRDMRKLGVAIPDAWFEATHAFRRAISKDGINFRALSQSAERAKPGSLRRRAHEIMADGIATGTEYDQDIVGIWIAGIHALREHAATKAWLNAIKFEKGVPLKLFVAQEHRLVAAIAGREHAWSKVVQRYVHGSLRGKPAKPMLRADKFGNTPSDELFEFVNDVAEINTRLTGRPRQEAIRPLRDRIDALTKRSSARLKVAKTDFRVARESVNKQVQAGERFGRPGEVVEVSTAPFTKFPELQGRLYLKEDMDYFLKLADDPNNPFVGFAKLLKVPIGVMKTFQTAFDPGFWFIQGLGAIGLDFFNLARGRPSAIWAKSMWQSIIGLTNQRAAARFWAEQAAHHPDDWAEFLQHGRVLSNHTEYSDEVVAEAIGGGWLEKAENKIPIINKLHPISRVGNAFANFMDAAAWFTWKAERPLAKTVDEVEELGALVRNISGRNSSRGLGMSYGQEMVERSLVYARSYTRAGTAILAKAAFDPLSFGGRRALESLAGIGMAMTFLVAGASLAKQLVANGGNLNKVSWDDLGDDLKAAWSPTKSTFMSIRIGDQNFGLGGTMRSTINAIAKLGALGFDDPKNLNPIDFNDRALINWDHPMIRFVRGKSSPVVGAAWDLISGQDFLGYQMDDPKDYWKLPLQMAPFASQAFIEATGVGTGERVGVGAAEWFGLRTYPVSAFTRYKEEVERTFNEPFENLKGTDTLKFAEKDEENYPELFEAKKRVDDQQRAKGDDFQEIDDQINEGRKEKEERLLPLAMEIDWGRPGGGELFSEQNKLISAEYRNDWTILAEAKGITFGEDQEFENKDAELEAKLIELDPLQFRQPDGNIDWDTYNAESDKIKSQMSPRNRKAVEEKRFNVDNPQLEETLRRKAQASEDLEPWFDAPKYKGLNKEEGDQVDSMLDLVGEAVGLLELQGIRVSRKQILIAALQAGLGDKRIMSTALVLTNRTLAPMVKSDFKTRWAMTHPDLIVFYDFIFFDLSEEEQMEWLERHQTRLGPTQRSSFITDADLQSAEEAPFEFEFE